MYLSFWLIGFLCFTSTCLSHTEEDYGRVKPKIHIISVGINKYPGTTFNDLRYCVNDSKAIAEKIVRDNKESKQRLKDSFGNAIRRHGIINGSPIILNDENATITNIKDAFKKVVAEASPYDYFVFLFSGYTTENENGDTFIVPYVKRFNAKINWTHNRSIIYDYNPLELLSIVELSKLMNQISCKKQLIISEAGNGTTFSESLISELFESNPIIAEGTERNRIILSTKALGMDGGTCDGENLETGLLTHYITQAGNLLDVFYDDYNYEFWLTRAEMMCPFRGKKYTAIFKEASYRNILLRNYKKLNSRGAKAKQKSTKATENVEHIAKTHAIVIATDTYNNTEDWDNLKNPINDAKVISNILKESYGVETYKLYNKTKEELLKSIIELKTNFNSNDQLVFFVAGHGYFSESFSDGYIVLKDSKPLSQDVTLESYLQMATIHRLLDNMEPNNVFAIFDVCFGASFDLNSKDVSLSDYNSLKRDISVSDFVSRKNKNTSRLFLASGKQEVPDFWDNSLDHSPFANKIISCLQNENEFISVGKLYNALQGNITEPILKQFGKHEVNGDLLIKTVK